MEGKNFTSCSTPTQQITVSCWYHFAKISTLTTEQSIANIKLDCNLLFSLFQLCFFFLDFVNKALSHFFLSALYVLHVILSSKFIGFLHAPLFFLSVTITEAHGLQPVSSIQFKMLGVGFVNQVLHVCSGKKIPSYVKQHKRSITKVKKNILYWSIPFLSLAEDSPFL